MIGETNYRLLSECKSSSGSKGTEPALRLFGHTGVTINRGNSSINQNGVGSRTEYQCKGRCFASDDN